VKVLKARNFLVDNKQTTFIIDKPKNKSFFDLLYTYQMNGSSCSNKNRFGKKLKPLDLAIIEEKKIKPLRNLRVLGQSTRNLAGKSSKVVVASKSKHE
jgi:hypothetical protein